MINEIPQRLYELHDASDELDDITLWLMERADRYFKAEDFIGLETFVRSIEFAKVQSPKILQTIALVCWWTGDQMPCRPKIMENIKIAMTKLVGPQQAAKLLTQMERERFKRWGLPAEEDYDDED